MKKIVKIVFLVIFVFFSIVFFSRGNISYENTNVIEKSAIMQFEKDLKDGKEIIPSHYITPRKDYSNRPSKFFFKISRGIEYVMNKTLKKLLKSLSN